MPQVDFIDVRIMVDGQPLVEYLKPDDEANTDDSGNVYYVEAVTGQNFTVSVTWLAGFQTYQAPYLYCRLHLDDHHTHWRKAHPCKGLRVQHGSLIQDLCQDFKTCKYKDSSGQWGKYSFSFGALGLKETLQNSSLTHDQLKKIGRIRVTIYRADQVLRAVPYLYDGEIPETLDQIPEKMAKGRHIKNNVKYEKSNDPATPPETRYYEYVPMHGEAGNTTEILQHIGCIPRTPSPPPDHALMLQRTEGMLQDEKEAKRQMSLQIQRLREENRRLRNNSRENSVMLADDDLAEHSNDAVDITPGRGLKRERNEEDDELEIMAPPAKKPAIIVDLTDD